MDDNIMRVLQLVQDGKITAQEAEGLIAALSGKAGNKGQGTGSSTASNGGGGTATATMSPPAVSAAPPETAFHETPETTSYARAQGLPTGELLQQIADDPSIPEHDKLTILINATSLLCGILIVQPIPLADFFILTPIQVAGVLAMSQVMGQPLGKNNAGELVTSIAAVVGGGMIAQQLMYAGVKTFVPILGGIAIIPVVYGATYGLMSAARAILDARRSNQHLSDEEIRRIKSEAERRAKNEGRDWSPNAIKRDLDLWRIKGEAFKRYEDLFLEEQRRTIALKQDMDMLAAQTASLSQQRMDLERQLQSIETRLTDAANDVERQTLQSDRKRAQDEIARLSPLWAARGADLDSKRHDIEQIQQRLEDVLHERFGISYPNIHFAPGVLAQLAATPYAQLRNVERQISLLQFEPVKVNYQNDPVPDANGEEIRMVASDDLTRLYTTTQGSIVVVRGIGAFDSEGRDIARLQASRL